MLIWRSRPVYCSIIRIRIHRKGGQRTLRLSSASLLRLCIDALHSIIESWGHIAAGRFYGELSSTMLMSIHSKLPSRLDNCSSFGIILGRVVSTLISSNIGISPRILKVRAWRGVKGSSLWGPSRGRNCNSKFDVQPNLRWCDGFFQNGAIYSIPHIFRILNHPLLKINHVQELLLRADSIINNFKLRVRSIHEMT